MIDLLKNKIEEWSREKLIAYNDNHFVPFLPKKSTFIQEMHDEGLCVYNEHSARFYFNNGDISSLSDKFAHDDWNYYQLLYNHANEFRMSKPIDCQLITVLGKDNLYLKFSSPTGQLGMPVYALKDTTEFYQQYIDHVEWIIKILDDNSARFPDDAISPIKIVGDVDGFYFCPIAGAENFSFTRNKDDFIKDQMGRLILVSHSVNPDDTGNQTNWSYLKEYAKTKWYAFKTPRSVV
jgi:hypothetical protein